jgi:adenine deaminase
LQHPPAAQDFRLPARSGRQYQRMLVLVIGANLRRTLEERTFPVRDDVVDFSGDEDICLVSIIERHGGHGNQCRVLVRGLGLREGAAATTVSHDCHNLLVIGRSEQDMALAAQTLADCGGGICSVSGGVVKALLPLPVGGLMNPGRVDALASQLEKLNQALKAQGILQKRPLTGLLSLALPVIPAYGITDLGLVDVANQSLVEAYKD